MWKSPIASEMPRCHNITWPIWLKIERKTCSNWTPPHDAGENPSSIGQAGAGVDLPKSPGLLPYIQCEDCGWTGQCVQCDVSLTYHQFAGEMRCHYCGYKEKVPQSCPACGSTQLTTMGMGTERIEESLSLLFPEARMGRMDLDTTRNKYGYQRLLDEFGAGQIDILVGTQMITKGLDFGKVTVVGIWDGDRILNFPDFRSGERAFQQITQVAGRAGRREVQGQVIIQSRNPNNDLYKKVIKGDYFEFFRQE